VLTVEPLPGSLLLRQEGVIALRPQLAEPLPPELGVYASDALPVARLGFQGIVHIGGHAILDDTALPIEPHSTAIIAGPTRSLERIRQENPDIAFRYRPYKPTRRGGN